MKLQIISINQLQVYPSVSNLSNSSDHLICNKTNSLDRTDTCKYSYKVNTASNSNISFKKSVPFSIINKFYPDGKISDFIARILKIEEKSSPVASLEDINRIKTGTNGIIRSETELSPQDLEMMINHELKVVTSDDIKRLIGNFEQDDQKLAAQIYNKLTQFGNMNSLNSIRSTLREQDIQVLYINRPSIADNLEYIFNKFKKEKFFENNSNRICLLDDEVLYMLKNNKEFAENFNKSVNNIIYPESWINGITPFNQTKDILAEISVILPKIKSIIRNKDSNNIDQAISQAINEPVLKEIKDLQETGILNPNIQFEIIRNKSLRNQKDIYKSIENNLMPNKINAKEIDSTLKRLPEKHRQITLEMLAHDLRVFSPKSLSERLCRMHKQICPDGNIDGIYFLIPNYKKSFNFITTCYKSANKIPSSHIIGLYSPLPEDVKKIVVLDDLSASGMSLRRVSDRIRDYYKGDLIIAPVFAVDSHIYKFTESPKKITFIPGEVITSFKHSEFYLALPDNVKEQFSELIQIRGWGQMGLNTVFPYMAPDNNNGIFSYYFAKYFIIDSK